MIGDLDLTDAWLQVRRCIAPATTFDAFTSPIMHGHQDSEFFLRATADNIAKVAEDFDIDAVHVDAASFYVPYPHDKLYRSVREALNPKRLMACEFLNTWEEFDFHAFSQGAAMDPVMSKIASMMVRDVNGVPVMEGLREYYAWMNKLSPVCDFVREYMVYYPHLCSADGFVPVGKVCNVLPPRKLPFKDEELWRILRDAKRLRYVPGLRVNYREYGLDAQTARALEEINV